MMNVADKLYNNTFIRWEVRGRQIFIVENEDINIFWFEMDN